jgi:hypothetical protein
MSHFDQTNCFDEPLYLPTTFEHPNAGKFKDEPEAFFLDKAVHIYVDVELDGTPMLAPCWLDVLRFEDKVLEGRPQRVGVGRVQKGGSGDEMFFWPVEVFDVIQRMAKPEGGVYCEIARTD